MRAATADVIAWQDHGDHEARARAIASVEDLVWQLARRAHRRVGRFGVDLDDLVSAGWEGATVATERFDRARGVEFFAAASFAIHERVSLAARRMSGVVALPNSVGYRDLEIAVNRAAASGEGAGMSPDEALAHAATTTGISTVDATAIARRSHAVSFDPEKHDQELDGDDPLASLQAESIGRLLDDCLGVLTPREAEIVRAHHLGGVTLVEIAAGAGTSAQRIGQIQIRAIGKLTSELRRRRLTAEDLL